MVKLERCWPWLERRGLQSTAKCSSAAPEACAVGDYGNAGQSFHDACQHGLARSKISTFYVEAIVGTDNEASKYVAAATISTSPVEVTDQFSGLPALQYVRKIGEDTFG